MQYILRNTLMLSLCALAGCRTVEKSFRPSHFRDWVPEQALLPQAEVHGSQVTIRNVRNCQYFANDVYLVDYYDKTVDLNAVRSVDYIVVPFTGFPALAHTMMSFEIQQPDGKTDYLAVSVETRKEKSERYNPVKGSARQYELMYVLADERDVLQLRTNFNREDVFLYHTTATPEAARMLLADVLGRVNELAKKPEFYDTLTNNCTSNIVDHVNRIKPNRVVADVPRAVARLIRQTRLRRRPDRAARHLPRNAATSLYQSESAAVRGSRGFFRNDSSVG